MCTIKRKCITKKEVVIVQVCNSANNNSCHVYKNAIYVVRVRNMVIKHCKVDGQFQASCSPFFTFNPNLDYTVLQTKSCPLEIFSLRITAFRSKRIFVWATTSHLAIKYIQAFLLHGTFKASCCDLVYASYEPACLFQHMVGIITRRGNFQGFLFGDLIGIEQTK